MNFIPPFDWNPCVKKVFISLKEIEKQGIRVNYPLLIAVSGGADSIALLQIMRKFYPPKALCVLHFDHQIRGEESIRDAQFVRDTAHELGISCLIGTADVRNLADQMGISIEMMAKAKNNQIGLVGLTHRYKEIKLPIFAITSLHNLIPCNFISF